MSATGPVPLNVTPASDSASPKASSAFTLIPAVMEAEKDGTPPDFKLIQPWNLAHSIPVYSETSSKKLPCFYDASAQEYWLFTIEGAVLLHKTPEVVLKKRRAVQVLGRLSSPFRYSETEILQQLGLPRSQSPLIANRTILENSLHDSVTVLRNSGASSFLDYWESKSEIGGNNIIYCSKCTSYRFPTDTNTTDTLTFGPPIPIGRIAVSPNVARALFARCLQPKQKYFGNQRAYDVLSKCFHKPTFDSIPTPQSYMVANLPRDSLFVVVGHPRTVSMGQGRRENWTEHFADELGPQLGAGGGIAAGAAIVGTGAAVGLGVSEVLLGV
ncbi:hypothetical protein BJX62DRAFT_253069 [Aspergillus germanicus]